MKSAPILAAGATLLALCAASRADTLALWTFDQNLPATWGLTSGLTAADAGPFAPELGTGSASAHHLSSSTYSAPAGSNASYRSLNSTRWTVGDYYQFTTSSAGYQDVAIAFDVTGSSTGPRDFKIAYGTDGTTFTDFGTYTVSDQAFTHVSFDFASVPALDNAASIYFRLIDTSTTSITGSTVGRSSGNRIDTVSITASVFSAPATPAADADADAVPLPASALAGSALLALLAATRHRRRRRS
jgi:hypothetical protein